MPLDCFFVSYATHHKGTRAPALRLFCLFSDTTRHKRHTRTCLRLFCLFSDTTRHKGTRAPALRLFHLFSDTTRHKGTHTRCLSLACCPGHNHKKNDAASIRYGAVGMILLLCTARLCFGGREPCVFICMCIRADSRIRPTMDSSACVLQTHIHSQLQWFCCTGPTGPGNE